MTSIALLYKKKKSDTKNLVNAVCMYDFSLQNSVEAFIYSLAEISAVAPRSSIFLSFKIVMTAYNVCKDERQKTPGVSIRNKTVIATYRVQGKGEKSVKAQNLSVFKG